MSDICQWCVTTSSQIDSIEYELEEAQNRIKELEAELEKYKEPVEEIPSQFSDLLYTKDDLKNSYKQGWLECADWSERDDLKSDIDSMAYLEERKTRIGV